jgi:endo-1,4-beta-xylanase
MHMFVGPDQYLPSWLKDGTWDQETLDQLLRELISSTISSVEGRDISVWNVVNEAIDWGGTGWGGTKFLELGYEADASGLTGDDRIFDEVPVYVRKAFEYARQSSGAELELRDYDNDGLQNQYDNSIVKTKAFYQLVRHLLALETPLDVVGLQGHFNIDNAITWSRLTDNVRRYRSLGLKVLISEMDAQQNDNAKTWDDSIADVQGAYYYDYVRAALIGGVNGIFVWGVRDNQDRGWRSGENAVLFDAAGDPKPAYYGVQRAFAEFASTAGSAGDFAVTSSHAGGGGGTSAASASDGRGGAAFAMGGAAGRGGTGSGAGTTQNIELELAPKGAGGEADSDVESDSLDGQPTEPSSPGHDPNTTAGGGEHARAQSSSSAQRPRLNQLGGGGCACGAAPARDLPVQVLFFALLALRARKRAREAGDT